MEHDDELRIREKIRNLDNTPLPFDKDLTWSSIRLHGTRPLRRIFFYYAAASLVLAAAIVFYSIELTHRVELRARISELDLTLEHVRSTVNKVEPIQVASTVECPEEKEAAQKPLLAKRDRQTRPAMTVKTAAPDQPHPVEVKVATAPEQLQETAAASRVAEPSSKSTLELELSSVSPVILGRSLAGTTNQAVVKKGRLQMRLFRGDDEITSGVPPSAPITTLASINNR